MLERNLVERFQRGGRARKRAFTEIVERWREPLFRVCFRLTSHREDAEDAVQEALSQAYLGLDAYRGDARISTWLFRIAVRAATRVKQKRAAKEDAAARHATEAGTPETHDVTPERILSEREQAERLLAALDRLPWSQRIAISLSAVEALDREEVAEVMGVPVGTVDSRLHHARKKLSEILGIEP